MTQAFNLAQLANNVNSAGKLAADTGLTNAVPVANGGTGSTTLTTNSVLLGNGTSAVQLIAPSTSGNVLTSNGTTWASTALAGILGVFGQVFASSGTFTVPAGVTAVKVTVVGGGGGGASSTGYGGGGGGFTIGYLTGLTPGGTITATVGAGGGINGAGGTSSFSTLTATGGAAGTGTPARGVGSGGVINSPSGQIGASPINSIGGIFVGSSNANSGTSSVVWNGNSGFVPGSPGAGTSCPATGSGGVGGAISIEW